MAGWYAHALRKASLRRQSNVQSMTRNVYNNITVGKDVAGRASLSIHKVGRVELFGGLKHVSHAYFMFILRMEYVLTKILTPEKLVMMRSDLITNVYGELSSNPNDLRLIRSFYIGGSDTPNDDTFSELVVRLTRSYCRMRGKDFVRKYMQFGFKNKNLGKGIRPTLAVISNPEVRKALGSARATVDKNK